MEKRIHETAPTLQELYPDFDEPQRRQAAEHLDRYLTLAIRVFARLEDAASNAKPTDILTPFRPEVGSGPKDQTSPN